MKTRYQVEGLEGSTSYPRFFWGATSARKAAQRQANKTGRKTLYWPDSHPNETKAVYPAGKSNPSKRKKSARKRISAALKKFVRSNPKGHKVKGGRAVTLHNFTGSIIRKSNGQVEIKGRGRKK
jgi:hypothetical protein